MVFAPARPPGEGRLPPLVMWSGNLPGWRWAMITKVALDRLSRSLHSDVCDSDGLRDAAIHSTISGRGSRRDRAASNSLTTNPFQPGCVVGVFCVPRHRRENCTPTFLDAPTPAWSILCVWLFLRQASVCIPSRPFGYDQV